MNSKNIIFLPQHRFKDCVDKIPLPFDFYLPDYNTCIEFNGIQHYKPKEYFDNWFLPENLKDYKNFISVGSMHNFSYLGGLTGLIVGIIHSVNQKRKSTKSQQSV